MNDILEHHGILGQKWGHQNGPPYPLDASDHSMSENKAGWEKSIKKASKAYKKETIKAEKDVRRNATSRYVKAYNKTAKYMNDKGIKKYNSEHKASDSDYDSGYEKLFNSILDQNINSLLLSDFENNKHYKKSQDIAEKYGLEKYDSLVKNNIEAINKLREMAEGT